MSSAQDPVPCENLEPPRLRHGDAPGRRPPRERRRPAAAHVEDLLAAASTGAIQWYATGPSNFSACCDLPWPGDAGPSGLGYVNQLPSRPGALDRGWWNVIKAKINPADLVMPPRNNAVCGYSVCNYLNPYCCKDGATFRVESCPGDDAPGDAVCSAYSPGSTCERSFAYALEGPTTTPWENNFEGIDTIVPTVVTFAPGPNECTRSHTSAEQIVDATRELIDLFLGFPTVERVNLHMGISWHHRFTNAAGVCANLWDVSCSNAQWGGDDCAHTFDRLVTEYDGRVVIQDEAWRATNGTLTMSGARSLYELYTSDKLHENIFGWYRVTLPDMLENIGIPVSDTPPPHPEPVLA
jgi:hypothetical protein